MLILAGVSLNAIVGDNGIITNAQQANILQSCAQLEEFLNEFYVTNWEELDEINSENRIEALEEFRKSKNWFYKPIEDGVGNLNYIIDNDGYAYYFIDKSKFEKANPDIKLVGGKAGSGHFTDYSSFNDVYGVTSDLKVYYAYIDGKDNIRFIGNTNFDKENLNRIVFANNTNFEKTLSSLGYDVDKDGEISVNEMRSVKELTIDNSSLVSDLNALFNFISLKTLTINGVTMESLNGIQNCPLLEKVVINNSVINNFSGLSKVKRLSSLTLNMTTERQLEDMCNEIKNADYSRLAELFVSNNTTGDKVIRDITPLSYLSKNMKEKILKLDLSYNLISDLMPIKDFVNVNELNLTANNVTTITPALNNFNSITSLNLNSCSLGKNEIYDTSIENKGKNSELDALSCLVGKTKLKTLNLNANRDLKWISYIKNLPLTYLNLSGCTSLIWDEVVECKDIINKINKSGMINFIDNKYSLALIDENNTTDISFSALTLDSENFISCIRTLKNLKNLNIAKLILTKVDNNGNTVEIKGNEYNTIINRALSKISNLERVNLEGLADMTSCEFLKTNPKMIELNLSGTNISTIVYQKDEEGNYITKIGEKGAILYKISYGAVVDEEGYSILDKAGDIQYTGLDLINTLPYLTALKVDNGNINFSLIKEKIKVISQKGEGKYFNNNGGAGICISSNECLEKFVQGCSDFTELTISPYAPISELDLSKMFNLKKLSVSVTNGADNLTSIKLPKSLEGYYSYLIRAFPTLDNTFVSLKEITISYYWSTDYLGNSLENRETELWKSFEKLPNIEKLTINNGSNEVWEYDSLLNISSASLKYLNIQSYANRITVPDLKFIKNIPNLETLYVNDFIVSSLSGIENCTNLKVLNIQNSKIIDLSYLKNLTNLEDVNLKNNSIRDLKYLENLKSLQSLNLENNTIYNTSVYQDPITEEYINYKNLEILAKLNPDSDNDGRLRNLYLAGNSSLTDFSLLTNGKLKWTQKSGF